MGDDSRTELIQRVDAAGSTWHRSQGSSGGTASCGELPGRWRPPAFPKERAVVDGKETFERVAMCVGKCSRILGPSLLVLGALSIAANILLLFPGGASKYLMEGHISQHAKAMPGIWGGGITVMLAATHITAVGWRCAGCSDCGTRRNAFISAVLSKLALLGAAACFILSGVGLTNGPLCFYNATEYGHGHGTHWGYPFLDAVGQEPDIRTENYLHDRHTWSICLEPEGIVAWNVVLFSLLLLASASEMVLASLQILNGCIGCLCGFCEGK